MSKRIHFIYIFIMSLIVAVVLTYLIYLGYSYYSISIEERFFNENHEALKPSGVIGHGLGIVGSLLMIFGVSMYMIRKRAKTYGRVGLLKHWLEFHIFLCTLGPILVLFHTSFKFGGIVSISFWSMVAVFLSGVIGRFIYIQIPRSIEGKELSLSEVKDMKGDIGEILKSSYNLDEDSYNSIVDSVREKDDSDTKNVLIRYYENYSRDRNILRSVKKTLKKNKLSGSDYNKVIDLIKNDIALNRRIQRLNTMQNLFKYWHVAHLPFALVMLIIMIIHVIITIVFGYKWIF